MAVECLARFGEREFARRAIEQAHAEFSLQSADATTELRSLHAQPLGGSGIAAAVDNLGKEIEVVQILEGVHGL